MNNNKNKQPLTSFAKSVLTEMIRLMPVQMDIWRLEKEIRTLKSQNLELTSRLAAVESGMVPMASLRMPVRFSIEDWKGCDHNDTCARIDTLDGPDEENEKTLDDTIRAVAEKIAYERPETNPVVHVRSTHTGISYAVDYSKDVFPSALVRIYYPNGTVENCDAQDAAKLILHTETAHACGMAPETKTEQKSLPTASLKFEITDHTMKRTLRKVELEGKDFVADARNLNDAIRHTADSIMEPGENTTTIGVVSLQTGRSFIVPYEKQAFPRASVSIMHPDGNTDVMHGTVSSTGKFIIDTDAPHPTNYKEYMAAPDADVKSSEEPKKERGIGPSEVFLSFYQRDMGLIGKHALAGNSITKDAAELNDKIEKFAKDITNNTCVPVKLVIESRETKVAYEVTYRKEKFPHADICIIDPRHYGTRTESTFNAGRCILHLDGKCKGGHAYASEPGTETDKPKLAFRIHDAEYRHIGQVNLNGRVFVIDMEELSTAIRRAADLLKRQFREPSRLRLISDTTGRGYDVVYDEARWPYTPSVTLVTGAGSCEEKRYTFHEIQNTAAWIIEHDIKPDTKWADDEQRKKF